MEYISTRGKSKNLQFEDVLLTGLAPDGGLYVPKEWPLLNYNELKNTDYHKIAAEILHPFLSSFVSYNDLIKLTENAYRSFETKEMAPLVQLEENRYILELFHGPTLAFKDFAMLLLAELFDLSLKKRNEKITIIGATSGDTGSAAIEAFKNSQNVNVFIFFPKGRVSEVQRKQMTTTDGSNIFPIEIDGTFDDCQNIVKDLFKDNIFNTEVKLGAINSINWGRIAAQIVYYFTSFKLLKNDLVSYSVPTGNFGDILAGWVAKQMGLPIKNLMIATNENDILSRALKTGIYSIDKAKATISPSMDIQISSNFERQLFESVNRNSEKIKDMFQEFSDNGSYTIEKDILDDLQSIYSTTAVNDEKTLSTIKLINDKFDYMADPHTATGLSVLLNNDKNETWVSLACAHPAKFGNAIEKAIGKPAVLPKELSKIFDKEEKMTILQNNKENLKSLILSTL